MFVDLYMIKFSDLEFKTGSEKEEMEKHAYNTGKT